MVCEGDNEKERVIEREGWRDRGRRKRELRLRGRNQRRELRLGEEEEEGKKKRESAENLKEVIPILFSSFACHTYTQGAHMQTQTGLE